MICFSFLWVMLHRLTDCILWTLRVSCRVLYTTQYLLFHNLILAATRPDNSPWFVYSLMYSGHFNNVESDNSQTIYGAQIMATRMLTDITKRRFKNVSVSQRHAESNLTISLFIVKTHPAWCGYTNVCACCFGGESKRSNFNICWTALARGKYLLNLTYIRLYIYITSLRYIDCDLIVYCL